MKKFLLLIFLTSLLFAVKQVPRTKKANDDKKSKIKVEKVVTVDKKNPSKDKHEQAKKKDHFKDADSNGVNDNREDDFQKIKKLNSKFKDQLKRKTADKRSGKKKKPKLSTKKKTK